MLLHNRSVQYYQQQKEEVCRSFRRVAFVSVALSTVACMATSIILPSIFWHVSYSHQKLEHEMEFCMIKVRELWKDLVVTRLMHGHNRMINNTNRSQREANESKREGIWAFGRFLPFKHKTDRRQIYEPAGWQPDELLPNDKIDFEKSQAPFLPVENDLPPHATGFKVVDLNLWRSLNGPPQEIYPPGDPRPPAFLLNHGAPSSRPPAEPFDNYEYNEFQNEHHPEATKNIYLEQEIEASQSQSCCTCHRGLPGSPGVAGSDGLPGFDGLDGIDGANGATVTNIERYNLKYTCISCVPGHLGAPGLPGWKGAPGPPGEQGFPADIYLTGMPGPVGVSGEAGADGALGRKGFPGPPGTVSIGFGTMGPSGRNGSIGPSGVPGAAGTSGIWGTPGITGDRGEYGHQGIMGLPGNDGITGSKGHRGVPGSCDHCPIPKTENGYGLQKKSSWLG